MKPLPMLVVQRNGALLRPGSAPAELQLQPGVIPALARLSADGYRCVLLGSPDDRAADADALARLAALCRSQGIALLADAHGTQTEGTPASTAVELLGPLLREHRPDPGRSAVIGDDAVQPVADFLDLRRLDPGEAGWPHLAAELASPPRRASVTRRTSETEILVEVDLDREGPQNIDTGLGFFDHMLEQIGRHGGFALNVRCRGDLHIDEHHTVEDCALALGSALDQALGERRGIARFGFLLPMDETRAQVAIDLGGRPYSVFRADFARDHVGGLSTEMVPHFFRSLAETLRANIHVEVTGENTHHMVEAAFKGVGRALRGAVRREGSGVPSTKGLL